MAPHTRRRLWMIDDESAVIRKGERMAEEGTLSIVRRGTSYQVRYASNNPHAQDQPPHACHDEETLRAFLHQLGVDVVSMRQACVDVRKVGVAVLPIVLSPAQIQACFRPPI
jgi:hypothetical protein